MNPNIGEQYTDEIMKKFGLSSVPKIIYDNSSHYKCYLDKGWKADKGEQLLQKENEKI